MSYGEQRFFHPDLLKNDEFEAGPWWIFTSEFVEYFLLAYPDLASRYREHAKKQNWQCAIQLTNTQVQAIYDGTIRWREQPVTRGDLFDILASLNTTNTVVWRQAQDKIKGLGIDIEDDF
jgi:hypothetical protein